MFPLHVIETKIVGRGDYTKQMSLRSYPGGTMNHPQSRKSQSVYRADTVEQGSREVSRSTSMIFDKRITPVTRGGFRGGFGGGRRPPRGPRLTSAPLRSEEEEPADETLIL